MRFLNLFSLHIDNIYITIEYICLINKEGLSTFAFVKKINHNSMRKLLFYIIFFTAGVTTVQAQQHITLEEATDLAIKNNESLRQYATDTKIAKEQSAAANAIFMPQIDMDYTAMVTNNPLNSFGFKLNQEIVTQDDFNPASLNDPGNNQNFGAQLQMKQPLLNLDAIYKRQSARKMAKVKLYSQQYREKYLRFQIKKAYMQIALAYENEKMMRHVVDMAKSFADRAGNMNDEGLIQTSDLLEAKTYLLKTQTQLQQAHSGIANSCDQLSLLMGVNIGELYTVDNLDKLLSLSISPDWSNRGDILAMKEGILATMDNTKANKMSLLPRINGFASYQLNDNRFAEFDANSYMAGISLSWKLFGGTQRIHKIKIARLSMEKMQSKLNQTQMQTQVNYNQSTRADNDLNKEIIQKKSMVSQMEEAWRIQSDRYDQGLASTSDLLRVQSQLAQQHLSLAMTYFKRNVNMAWMQLLTGK